MKELSTEEKAKAYDKALEKAKDFMNGEAHYALREGENIMCWIFPELKKFDDEKIRGAIIHFIPHTPTVPKGIIGKETMIAWLEKQSNQTSWKPSKEEMDVLYGLAYITNQYDEHKEEVITRLYQDLKRELFNGSSYENMFPDTEDGVRRRSTIQVLEYAKSLDTYNQYGKADIDKNIAWVEKKGEFNPYSGVCFSYNGNIWGMRVRDNGVDILFNKKLIQHINGEKQSEQKDSVVDFDANDWYVSKVDGKIHNIYHSADKVKPKFKPDDWITNGICTWKIEFIKDGLYYQTDGDMECGGDIESIDKKYHLWTIQDAKDGDVLTVESIKGYLSPFVAIYKKQSEEYFDSYCFMGFDGKFYEGEEGHVIEGIHPATKKQRDTLMKVMADAGYTFDFDKKELKMISQRMISAEAKEAMYDKKLKL